MNTVKNLNNSLYRNLKNGQKYNRFFSKTACKATYVGSGSTDFGLQKMKEVIIKYQNQTQKIAKHLKASTVPKTVLNIKQFLYDHLQYSADGWEQNLKTPNCSWQTRETGIDCKSYSVFASSILLNCGIKNHRLRKITQPNSPDRWSHVYVVVDYKDKELIIDATVPYNYEVPKVKLEDLSMETKLPYNVLNGATQNVVVTKKTYQIATALDNFQEWLDGLEIQGVSKQTTDAIWFEVKSYLDKGIEPKIAINQNEIVINGKAIQFGISGLGFVLTTAAITKGVGSVISSGIFSKLFGKEDRASVLARSVKNEQPYLKEAESYFVSGNKYAALNVLQNRLSELKRLRAGFKSDNSKAGADKGMEVINAAINKLNNPSTNTLINKITPVIPINPTVTTGFNPNTNNNLSVNNPPRTQNAQGSNSDNKSNTGLIIGVSLVGLLVVGVVAKKMNII